MEESKMNIVAIEQITLDEQAELDRLNKLEEQRMLTDNEACRQLFLGMKQFWNCEC
jgi:hypothetical protein